MAIASIAGPLSSLDYRIRFAIAHRRLIEVIYKRTARLAEPHDYGKQNGLDRLFVYQLRGPAKPGHSPVGWRLLDVAKIESLVVRDDEFPGSRGADHDSHLDWDEVYARVK
jgi:hypothetical protein